MAWFSSSSVNTQQLDSKIEEATLESIPNGEFDVAIAFEITDLIKSKKIPPKLCMRSLKKRLTDTYQNPNLLTSTLKLIDVCVKNGGYHFLVELSSREFMDYLVDFIFKVNYNTQQAPVKSNQAKLNVGNLILGLIKNWSIFFKNQLQLNYVETCFNDLSRKGYEFPNTDTSEYLNGVFVDTDAPADWVDSDDCMICYKPFSMINRKHHCRSCGGVFCQEHSSHSIPLPSLGIMEPVRVCDNCHFKLKYKLNENNNLSLKQERSKPSGVDEEDEDLKKAIELSLKESGAASVPPPAGPPPSNPFSDPLAAPAVADDEDEEMKAAIAASLQEFKAQEEMYKQAPAQAPAPAAPEPKSDFYNNVLPFERGSSFQQPMSAPQMNQPQPPMSPAQHINYHKPKQEELTQNEEDSINLYITLVNQLKNDTSRQAGILHDRDLNDLHNKVIQIKPKLNKSLRNAIERYEKFVALNNKISTITKLYDQFLETKLSEAYGNHNIYTPYPDQSQNYGYMDSQPGHVGQQVQSGQPTEFYPQKTYDYGVPGQATGPQATGPQTTGPQTSIPQSTGTGQPSRFSSYNPTGQFDPYQNAQQTGQYPTSSPPSSKYDKQTGQPYPSQPGFEESEPNYDSQSYATGANYNQYTEQIQESEPQYPETKPIQESEPNYGDYDQAYNTRYTEELPSQLSNASYPEQFSSMTAYPPIEKVDGSVSIPQEYNRRDSQGSVESTRSRYPPIEDVETNYDDRKSETQFETTAASHPPDISSLPPPPTSFNSSSKPKVTEEALIEL